MRRDMCRHLFRRLGILRQIKYWRILKLSDERTGHGSFEPSKAWATIPQSPPALHRGRHRRHGHQRDVRPQPDLAIQRHSRNAHYSERTGRIPFDIGRKARDRSFNIVGGNRTRQKDASDIWKIDGHASTMRDVGEQPVKFLHVAVSPKLADKSLKHGWLYPDVGLSTDGARIITERGHRRRQYGSPFDGLSDGPRYQCFVHDGGNATNRAKSEGFWQWKADRVDEVS